MMKMKRNISVVLAAAVMLSAVGCGAKEEPKVEAAAEETAVAAQESAAESSTESLIIIDNGPEPQKESEGAASAQENLQEETAAQETEAAAEESSSAAGVYSGVLDRFHDLILTVHSGDDAAMEKLYESDLFAAMGVMEYAQMQENADAALKEIGYCVKDISGDGIDELLIGPAAGDMIMAVYTCVDGEPVGTLEGWYRNSYQMMNDGSFFYRGSGGAAYTMVGKCSLSADGTSLQWDECYFTDFIDEDMTEIGWYYNTTGEWDTAVSQLTDAPVEQIEAELVSQVETMQMTAFSEYK